MLDATFEIAQDSLPKPAGLFAVEPRQGGCAGVFDLAAQGDQSMAIARFGFLGVERLEQDDVAIRAAFPSGGPGGRRAAAG